MPTYTAARARSPYFVIEGSLTGGEVIDVDIRIWNEPDSEPVSATYSFSKTIPSTLVDTFTLDISPYVREYIEHSTRYNSQSEVEAQDDAWCYCTVKSYVDDVLTDAGSGYTHTLAFFDGYGYYLDGYNPSMTRYMLPAGTYLANETSNCGGLGYYDDGTVAGLGIQAKYTGLTTGGTTTLSANYTVGYFPLLHASYASEGNTLEYLENGSTIATYTIEAVCENKYTTYNCDFINRDGFWQRLVFFKNSSKDFSSKGETYSFKSGDVNFTTSDARTRMLNINGKESIQCNTGWVEESYDEVMRDLMLSERILLDNVPVILKTNSMKLQTALYDKMINYTIKFEYAHNQLQYVT